MVWRRFYKKLTLSFCIIAHSTGLPTKDCSKQSLKVPSVCVSYFNPKRAKEEGKLFAIPAKMFVPFVFSKSRFQGPAFRCDKIVVIVTLLEAIEGIPDKDYNFWGNEKFHNLY